MQSHGKAIVQTASGNLISTYSAFSGSSLSGVSLITINKQGDVHVKKIKNATLIRMYQKQTIRSIFNSSSQKIVIGSAGVSVTQLRISNGSLQSVQQILQRRRQQNAGAAATGGSAAATGGSAAATGGSAAAIGGNAAIIGANAVLVGGKLKNAGGYGSGLTLRQTGGAQNTNTEDVDESYGGKPAFSTTLWILIGEKSFRRTP